MPFRCVLSGCVALAVSGSAALGAIETRTVTITNNTSEPFARVVFYPLAFTITDTDRFAAVQFVDDLAEHSSPKNPVIKTMLDTPTNDRLAFEFESESLLEPGGTFDFVLSVDNPFDVFFTIGYRITPGQALPSPATALLAPLGLMAMRRRR